jgi:hypothetical protein
MISLNLKSISEFLSKKNCKLLALKKKDKVKKKKKILLYYNIFIVFKLKKKDKK